MSKCVQKVKIRDLSLIFFNKRSKVSKYTEFIMLVTSFMYDLSIFIIT